MPDLKQITIPDGTTYDLRDSRCVAATSSSLGLVQPDNSTITINSSGVISASGGGSQTTWWGTSSTAASTAAKVITCEGFTLTEGAIISIYFSAANTANVPTLNVNSTGAKSIRIGGASPDGGVNALKWASGTVLTFIYDGTYYRYLGAAATQGNYNNPNGGGSWYGTSSSAATAAAKTSSITSYRLVNNARVSITFSNANTFVTDALTLNVNSTGAKPIYVNNAATSASNTLTWDAGECLTFVYSGSYYYFVGRSKSSGGSTVSVQQTLTSGTEIGGITVDGVQTKLYAPSGGSGSAPTAVTITLPSSNWQNGSWTYDCAATIQGLAADSTVLVGLTPGNAVSAEEWQINRVRVTGQSANLLSFSAIKKPTRNFTVNVVFW